MDTIAWIWVIIAIVVILAIIGILAAVGTKRRRRLAEERKEQERGQAAKLRDEGTAAGLDARERQVAADRAAADAEQASVEADRLKFEAERQRSQAANDTVASQKMLHEADVVDPDVNDSPSRAHGRSTPDGAEPDHATQDSPASRGPAHRRTVEDS